MLTVEERRFVFIAPPILKSESLHVTCESRCEARLVSYGEQRQKKEGIFLLLLG